MGATTSRLYERDFAAWAEETGALIRAGRMGEVDFDAVAEEIEGLAKSERMAARSQLTRLMTHLVKARIQPQRAGKSWRASMFSARVELNRDLKDSPSLQRMLRDELEAMYGDAVGQALIETGAKATVAESCPWTL